MLVTAEGKWVLPDSDEFHAALGDPEPDYDAVGYAVRNLGFVKFQVLDRLVTEIELCPRNVDLRALLAMEKLLIEAGTNLFRVRWLADEWHSEISASPQHTLARLRELCAPVFEPVLTDRFRVEAQDPSVLFDTQVGRATPLGRLAMKWRVAFGNFDEKVLDIASRNDLLSLMAIVEFDQGVDTSPVFRFIGDGHSWANRQFKMDGIGEKVENMPDREYGHWITEFHQAVASTGQPRFDRCTAAIEFHAADEASRRKAVAYDRLLLPWRMSSGKLLITSCAAAKETPARAENLTPQSKRSVVK
jgi:hypothetical protein